jgi:hypothetical protein
LSVRFFARARQNRALRPRGLARFFSAFSRACASCEGAPQGRALRQMAWLLLLACLSGGCDDLKDFAGTRSNRIVGGNFVRSCFAANTVLTLHFVPSSATAAPDSGLDSLPNTISTDDGTFQDTPLEAITQLPQDPLSELDFPGPQRLRNYMLLARPATGPLAGRDALVVISLLASETTEVRVIARSADGVTSCPSDLEPRDAAVGDGAPPAPVGEVTRREYFGLWKLRKK